MDTIIEIPRKGKVQIESDYYETGWQDGLMWANHARYEELQYAANDYEITNNISEILSVGYDPHGDKNLGDYFSKIFEKYAAFGLERTKFNTSVPNDAFCLWEQGWYDAVNEFWHTIHTYDNP
jgi:hypothetical protein